MKKCSQCEVELDLELFSKHKYSKDGRRSKCRACLSKARRKPSDVPPGQKRCSSCKDILSLDSFGPNASRPDGRKSYCRPCDQKRRGSTSERTNESRRLARAEKREARILESQIAAAAVIATGLKSCKKCGNLKTVDSFWKRMSSLDGLYACCKACIKSVRNRPDPEDQERSERWAEKENKFDELVKERLGHVILVGLGSRRRPK